jgi:hypothetical protein
MIVAARLLVVGRLLVRQLSLANAWEIVFWRSAFMTLFVAGVLVAIHGARMPRAVRRAAYGLLAAAFLAGTFFFFIGSLTRNTVANTNILMSVSPFLAALAARVILKEPVPLRTSLRCSRRSPASSSCSRKQRTPDSSPATARARCVLLLRRADRRAAQVPCDGRHAAAGVDRRHPVAGRGAMLARPFSATARISGSSRSWDACSSAPVACSPPRRRSTCRH